MIKGSDKWQIVDEKLEELRRLVEGNWDKGEWELAVLGEGTIRTVEQSRASAQEMRQRADSLINTYKTILPNCEYDEGECSSGN